MPKAITCKLNQKTISIEAAIDLREGEKQKEQHPLVFRCIDCGKPVRPHRGNKNGASPAHFEHHEINKDCPLSVPER
ncbi:MAG: hypothetical protein ORN29_06690 [Rhodoferax sp.]|nr:hypothetical protein [Rhodoferax sp.]